MVKNSKPVTYERKNQSKNLVFKYKGICFTSISIVHIIIIIIFINFNWVVTRWQWLFYMYTSMKKKK